MTARSLSDRMLSKILPSGRVYLHALESRLVIILSDAIGIAIDPGIFDPQSDVVFAVFLAQA